MALTAAALITIAITVPGAGCVMASIAIGAIKGAVVGAVSGFAMGFIMGGASSLINCAVTGTAVDWGKVLNDSLNAGVQGAIDGAITGAIMGGIGGALKPKFCFVAGTKVMTANGLVAIENVKPGDIVLSRNDKTGQVEKQKVTQTFTNTTSETYKVKVGGESIEATGEHPFYVEGKGYLQAKYLQRGDKLVTVNGEQKIVEFIEHVIYEQPIAVYNFEVEGNHNYFVGHESRVLAHNMCKIKNKVGKSPNQLGKEGMELAKVKQNTTRIETINGKRKYRIPDKLKNGVIGEVKNVRYQGYTSQIDDYLKYAQKHDLIFELHTRQTTEFSPYLKSLLDSHIIEWIWW